MADVFRVLFVEKVKAELEVEQAKLEDMRAERTRRANGRERQREAGRKRSARAKRNPDGSFQPHNSAALGCFLCEHPGKSGFNQQQLDDHRRHKGLTTAN